MLAYFDNIFYERNKAGLYYDRPSNRLFLNLFVLNPRIPNSKGWNVIEQGNPDYEPSLDTVIGAPITLWRHPATNDFDHPQIFRDNASNEEHLDYIQSQRVGIALTKYTQKENGDVRTLAEFIEPNVKAKLVNWLETGKIPDPNDLPLFTSPELAHFDPRESIKKFWITHIALVSHPAFPKEVSMIKGAPCAGDHVSCGAKLAVASEEIKECKGTQLEDLLTRSYHIGISAASNTIDLMSMNSTNDQSTRQFGTGTSNNSAIANFTQSLDNARKVGSMTYNEAMAAVHKQFNESQQSTQTNPPSPNTVNIFTGQVGQPQGSNLAEAAKSEGQQQGTTNTQQEPPKQPETKADQKPGETQAPDDKNSKQQVPPAPPTADPEKEAMKATIKRFEEKEKKDEIAKAIPVAAFLSNDGQFDEKKANSLVEFWFSSNKKIDEITQYYKDNPPAAVKVPAVAAQAQATGGTPSKARASATPETNSYNSDMYKYDMNELAPQGAEQSGAQGEEVEEDPEAQLMIDNASNGIPDNLWFLGLPKLVILEDPQAPPRDKGKGTPRSVI